MASLLESIIGVRGYPTGYRDKIRAEILAPVEEKLQEKADKRRMGQSQEAYGKAAAALNLNAPDIGAIALLARADPTAASSLLMKAAQARTPEAQQAQQMGALQIEGQQSANRISGLREKIMPFELEAAQQAPGLARDAAARDQERLNLYRQGQEAQIAAARAAGQQLQQFGGLDPKEWLAQSDETRAISQGVGAARGMAKILKEYGQGGALVSPEAKARLQVGLFTMIPALQKSLNAGGQNALGTEEREFLTDFLGNPQGFMLRPAVTIAKLQAIAGKMEGDLDYRAKTRPYLPPDVFTVPSYEMPAGWVPLGDLQPRNQFYEGVGSGQINPGWGIPR
jgi:hypothetical protein